MTSGASTGQILVKATCEGEEEETSINVEQPTGTINVVEKTLVADGKSGTDVKLHLTYGGKNVNGHSILWRISQVKDSDDNPVSADAQGNYPGYGGLSSASGSTTVATDEQGISTIYYTAGTKPGLITFAATNNSVIAATSPATIQNSMGNMAAPIGSSAGNGHPIYYGGFGGGHGSGGGGSGSWTEPQLTWRTVTPDVPLYAFGNDPINNTSEKKYPSPPRIVPYGESGGDIALNENGMVPVQNYVKFKGIWPLGKSLSNIREPVTPTGPRYILPAGSKIPEGIGLVRDGKDVGGPQPEGHYTFYPLHDMTPEDFIEKFRSFNWVRDGTNKKK